MSPVSFSMSSFYLLLWPSRFEIYTARNTDPMDRLKYPVINFQPVPLYFPYRFYYQVDILKKFYLAEKSNLSDIINQFQAKQIMNPVIIGTIIWVILGVIAGWKILTYVAEKSPLGKEWENQKIALVAVIFGWIQMWALWACCYMHQMYPLIEPKIQF